MQFYCIFHSKISISIHYRTYFLQSPLNLDTIRYDLDEQLESLEVIPCGPTMFEQIVALPKDLSRNVRYRLHFEKFEFIGVMGKFDLKIYDMEQTPTQHFLVKLPKINKYLGLHFTADYLSPVWWDLLRKFKNLVYLQFGCNLKMVDILANGKTSNDILRTFPRIDMIEVEITEIQKETNQGSLLNFFNAYKKIESRVWVPADVTLDFVGYKDPRCSCVEMVNSNGVVGNLYTCWAKRKVFRMP